MTERRWVAAEVAHAVDDRQLASMAGATARKDPGTVESAVGRNLAGYSVPDAATLAASYAYGLARNHGFADDNKRTAWVLARLCLANNGYRLCFDKLDAVRIMEAVAAGALSEQQLADWFRTNLSTTET